LLSEGELANSALADSRMPAIIQGLSLTQAANYSIEHRLAIEHINYKPQDERIAVKEKAQAIIIYSDTLKESRALQQLILSIEKGQRALYFVNKETMPTEEFLKSLHVKGLTTAHFDRIFEEQDSAKAVDIIMPALAEKGIGQVRIFASSASDIEAWSRQKMVDALIMILRSKELVIISPEEWRKALYEQDRQRSLVASQA
jgi:hypothetical protein